MIKLHSIRTVLVCDKIFDAFLTYSAEDDVFVRQILAPELEQGGGNYIPHHVRLLLVGHHNNDHGRAIVLTVCRVLSLSTVYCVLTSYYRRNFTGNQNLFVYV